MIPKTEAQWLLKNCPTLSINEELSEVSGLLKFRAAYDVSDGFIWLLDQKQSAPGEILTDVYNITITKPENPDELPTLRIKDKDKQITTKKHFNPNGTACLCGPIEKHKFLLSGYSFIKYLDRLVVPFLYEQTYYDIHGKWPWGEYAHGVIGIFQSYISSKGTIEDVEACLKELQKDRNWQRINAILSGQERIIESSKCFCLNPGQIRKCHPWIWFAITRLRNDMINKRVKANIGKKLK